MTMVHRVLVTFAGLSGPTDWLWLAEKFKRPLLARRNGPQGARYTDTTGGFPASCLRTATLMLIGAKTSRFLQVEGWWLAILSCSSGFCQHYKHFSCKLTVID